MSVCLELLEDLPEVLLLQVVGQCQTSNAVDSQQRLQTDCDACPWLRPTDSVEIRCRRLRYSAYVAV
jgi:hypothetical protein